MPGASMRAAARRLVAAGALTFVGVIAACSDESAPSGPTGVSTATPASTAVATQPRATATPLLPEQVVAMTAAQLEPLLKAALVQRADIPSATWRITEVNLKAPTPAVKEAEAGDLTRNLGLIASNCFVAIPVTDSGAMGVMRVFSIETSAQATSIISAVFRTRDDNQSLIDRRQAGTSSPETAACMARVLGVTMTPQVPAGQIDVIDAGPSEGLPSGVGSMEFVGRIRGSGQVYTVSLASVSFAAGPLISVVAEIAVVPRDEVPVLPGRPLDLLRAGGTRLAEAIGAP